MKLSILLLSIFTFLASFALAQFDDFEDDDSFGVGGFNGIGSFGGGGGGDNFFESSHPIRGKKSKDGNYYEQTWSQVKRKGYPQKKKILRIQKKGEQIKDVKGDRKSVDGGEKKKVEGEREGKKGGIVDDAFGKGFNDFVGTD